jgi:helicase
MAFKSLFIGIDRYESPLISNLSCSVRDAQALHGLLGDAFSATESTLLVNEAATRAAILVALQDLQRSAPGDVVMISFSGHGSDSHHLITYDADPLRLDETAIHLDALTDLFARIPARNVLLLLDCCFAGGAGAKVFHAPIATKSPASASALLDKISGSGRVIFTAATAEQEAIEDRRRGHGLFTFFILEALRGAPEVIRGAYVPLLSLFEFVTRSVVQAARQIRHEQEPTLKGAIQGDLTLPVLTPGALFKSFFPDYGPVTVGANIDDLSGYGLPAGILERLHESIPSLNELQQEAINKVGLFTGQHLVVSAPTSSGKTMIGELAALFGYSKAERTYMLLPLRALVNDKYDEFTRKYAAFGLRIIRSTGEIADDNDALLRGKFNIALLTYERFAALAVTMPHVLRQVGVIVIDEVQMITDRNRGANLEFLLTLLKAQRLLGIEPQLIALSAVIGDTNGFESWLDARLIVTNKRPVPLDEGLIDMTGTFRYIAAGRQEQIPQYARPEYRKGSSQDVIIPLVRKLVTEGEKVIVFRETKPIVRATAEYLKNSLGLVAAQETLALMPNGDPSVASAQLRGCLEHGVAFHNADLDREERQAIESTFRDPRSSLKVLVATTTLAMGVNTPAWSVVIAGLEHPDSPYSVAEYKNMVGRAGRLGYTPKGKSFLVAATGADAHLLWHKYVLGHPEALVSRFSDQEPLSLVCRVLATAAASKTDGLSARELVDFVQSTFAAHQQGNRFDRNTITGVLGQLVAAGLVETLDYRHRLTQLGKVAGELGIHVESVVRIARALRGLPAEQVTDGVVLAAAQTSLELDDVLIPVHKKSIKERQRWASAVEQQRLPYSVARELRGTDDAGYTARCKRLSAALMWLDGVELNRLEASLLVHLPGENAAGPIRAVAERTRDLIGVVARIAALVSSDHAEPQPDIAALSTRLELGIPREILWLASIAKRGLERGDYLGLQRAGLSTMEALDRVEDAGLAIVLKTEVKVRRVRDAIATAKRRHSIETDDLPMPRPI